MIGRVGAASLSYSFSSHRGRGISTCLFCLFLSLIIKWQIITPPQSNRCTPQKKRINIQLSKNIGLDWITIYKTISFASCHILKEVI